MLKMEEDTITPLITYGRIALTEDCNEKCVYCYEDVRWVDLLGINSRKTITSDNLERIIERLEAGGIEEINLTGGEPFLKKDLVFRALQKGMELDLGMSVNSNASVPLKPEDAKRLKDLQLKSILVSFPSYDSDLFAKITGNKGSYARILKNFELFREHDINIAISMVVLDNNYDQVYDTGKFLFEKFGVTNFAATPIAPTTLDHFDYTASKEKILGVFDQLITLREDFGIYAISLRPFVPCFFGEDKIERYNDFLWVCNAGVTSIIVRPDGSVNACPPQTEDFGNILHEDLDTISARMSKWYKKHSGEDSVVPSECEPCSAIESCKGGCRVDALTLYGSLSAPNPYRGTPLEHTVLPQIPPNLITNTTLTFKRGLVFTDNDELQLGQNVIELGPQEKALYTLFQKEAGTGLVDVRTVCSDYGLRKPLVNIFLNYLHNQGFIEISKPII
tara:strand:- start:154 stop:1500 length:1347 start_codon:yes stop_codon:yes gene_type:complete